MKELFEKYKSITQTYQAATVQYYRQNGFADVSWYVTEKIHGTNFSAMSDGESIIYCQRSGPIPDSFFNYQGNVHKIEQKVLNLAKEIGQPIQVIFEYYGKGITSKPYIPYRSDDEKDFIAYDIRLVNENKYMAYPQNFQLLQKHGIPTTAVLFEGSFDECLKFSPEIKSTLAASNGSDTNAEGVVLKPFEDLRTGSGERVLLKNVAMQFQETKLSKGDAAAVAAKRVANTNRELTIEVATAKATDMRVSKVASKFGVGVVDKAKFGILINELVKDIVEEAKAENGLELDEALVKVVCVPAVKNFFN